MAMTNPIGKRARSLLLLAGLLPVAASARQDPPPCQITEELSRYAKTQTSIYRYSQDEKQHTEFVIALRPHAYQNSDETVVLSDPIGARLIVEYGPADQGLRPRQASITIPFARAENERKVYGLTINVGEWSKNSDYDSEPYNSGADTLFYIDDLPKFDSLDKDIEIFFFELTGNEGTAAFAYSHQEAARAYARAGPQFDAVTAALRNGQCAVTVREECFLTTATCEAVGLDDDCWELRTLRRFRDEWLAQQEGGADDIATYYKRAPAIAEQLRQDRRAAIKLYWSRIMPSALAASVGANRLARAIYSKGMRELAGS